MTSTDALLNDSAISRQTPAEERHRQGILQHKQKQVTGDFYCQKTRYPARLAWSAGGGAADYECYEYWECYFLMDAPLKKAVFFNSLSVQKSGQQTKTELYLRLHLYFKSTKIILVRHFIRVKR